MLKHTHACTYAHMHAHTHMYLPFLLSLSAPPSLSLSCTHIVSLSPSSPHHHSRPLHSCSLSLSLFLWAIMRQLNHSGSINAHISCGVWILQKSYWQGGRVITEKKSSITCWEGSSRSSLTTIHWPIGPHSLHSSVLKSSADLERSTLLMPFPACPLNPLLNPSWQWCH